MDTEPPDLLSSLLFIDSTVIIEPIVLLGLLFCSALVSGAEVAFFSFSQTDINEAETSGNNAAKIVVK
ncbi:MAG: CNNM domain-containing protein, partial [Bacteroidota bacterium]